MVANIQTFLKETYGFTNFQIAQIRYGLLSILSEVSKLLLIGIYFAFFGNLTTYLVAAVILSGLRMSTGGLHFMHYWSCLLMSFLFFVAGVQLLPLIPTTKYVHIALLILCIWINYLYAPIVSSYRPIPDGIKVKKAKRQAFLFITVYAFLLFIIPENPYLTVGSWIIILQSLQLFVANLLQRRKKRETIQ